MEPVLPLRFKVTPSVRRFPKTCLLAWIWACSGCDRQAPAEGSAPDVAVRENSPGPQMNGLAGLPGAVLDSQADSAIHWQPWTKESLRLAGDSNRLILAVVAMPQQPDFQRILEELGRDQDIIGRINDFYVPILIDGDASRELGLLAAQLCGEIGLGMRLPLMIWMTPEVNPVAWIPLSETRSGAIPELFAQSDVMVSRMWSEDRAYVVRNSGLDDRNRRKRMTDRMAARVTSLEPGVDTMRSLRQLVSLYDPVSGTFDEAGGLFPCGALDLMALGAETVGIPEDLREKCRSSLGYLLDDLLQSAMFDPLDGGVFSSRRGSSWALPGFYRDCATQARVARSLLDCFVAIGDERALNRAMGVLDFIEREYRAGNGLFSLGSEPSGDISNWLWRIEDIEEVVTADELGVFTVATGMRNMGNLPSEVDPLREFFRENSLGAIKSLADIAAEEGGDPTETADLFDSARRKLLKIRDERMERGNTNAGANAAATFRVVSAYASAYQVTGEERFLEMAVSTLESARERFTRGPELVLYESEASSSLVGGRAFLYGLALQATLDVAGITLDENWLMWADDLATTSAELFGTEDFLRECPPDADLTDLPVSDAAMLFDDSTAGLFAMAGSRMEALGRPFLEILGKHSSRMPIDAIQSPILHTDVVQGAIMREFGFTFLYGADIPEKVGKALSRMPLKGINRGPAGRGHPLPAGTKPDGVVLIRAGEDAVPVKDPHRIEDTFLRNPRK